MEIGQPVKVANPNQINYPLQGVVTASDSMWGVPMSKVKFSRVDVWYANSDLEKVEPSKTKINHRKKADK